MISKEKAIKSLVYTTPPPQSWAITQDNEARFLSPKQSINAIDIALKEQAKQIFNELEKLGDIKHLCTQHDKWCDCYEKFKKNFS